MWEYFTIFGLVFMTWYDNLWMKKFERFAWKNGSWLIWEAMKLHTKVKNQTQGNVHTTAMIKDGYHVDAVFLYVHEKNSDLIKQYDMLRIFRENLVQPEEKPEIRIDSDMDCLEFVKLCCQPDTNFSYVDENLFYLLEVNYTFDRKKYRIYYDSKVNRKIRFPIYSEQQIRERDIASGGIDSAQITMSTSDDENGTEITREIKKIAGPMQNFYDDTEFVIKKSWFLDGAEYPKSSFIRLIDFKGELHTIKPDDIYLSFNRN